MSNQRTGGRILVDALLAQGCDRIFCVPGESYLAVLDALHDTPEIDLIVARQEGGVGFMAEADGAMKGRPGIAFVTRGPGATNASIGVHTAMQDSTPMILFIGDVARGDRDREAFQEIDFTAMFSPIAKWASRIDDAARIPEYVARAYAVAMSGRPGPVVLALPEDMLTDLADATDRPRVERPSQAVAAGTIAQVADLLAEAKNPVAIVGGAGWTDTAARSFAKVAEAWGLPVAVAFRRQDAIANECAVYAGNLGYGPNPKLLDRVRAADLLLVVGPRLGEATTDGYTLITPDHPGQKLIHIHPDPNELGSVFATDLAICAGVNSFALALETALYRVGEAGMPSSKVFPRFASGREAHAEWEAWATPAPNGQRLDLGQCVAMMRDQLPADSIICNGAGNFSSWWHRFWHYAGPVSQLAPTAGSMGYGLPAGVAAALRAPQRQVVVLAGDGCFLMNGQELATAVRYGLKMLILVIDNGSYGTIRMHQEKRYPARISGTDLANPDFAALARAYGAWAETVTETAEFGPALARAKEQTGVALLHLKTDIEQIGPAATISGLRASHK
ncbi:acetolactate synthase-1/2/3 large subunit [Sphingomonas laterariae]|uniref:Acetolactate synthase-1/2/3 large subunit n=1 Tax=Edaphosphingomonas laterariae TaxID=861865 RepID=A0A239CUR9_9SPHN|nr:thiamine pyrophosphate-binding protein [Sphingomonas laterariae]SNS23538.1 acetolactate synthase-1/2/3 large subunit [Sphingomonas laterariae]